MNPTLQEIFFYVFIVLGLINTLHFGFYLVGANFYDIEEMKRRKKLPKRMRRIQPLVTVLIPAHNEEAAIERCLNSVVRSSKRKLQIIVIDDASTDATAKIVRQYIVDHPKQTITLHRKRKNVGKGAALNSALKKFAQGEFVMTLDADSVLDKQAIRRALTYFNDPTVMGVAANVRVMEQRTVLGMLQKFEHMIGYRSKKFYSSTNSEFIIGGVASTYRRSVIRNVGYYDTDTVTEDIGLSLKVVALGNKNHRIVYGADVVAQTEGVQSYKALFAQRFRWKMGSLQNLHKYRKLIGKNQNRYSRMLTYYRLPMAYLSEVILLIEPILLGYLVYMSLGKHSTALFVGAYATITLYTLFIIWPDEHSSRREKVKLSAYSVVLYFTMYIMNVVQVVSMIRCLGNLQNVTRKQATSAVWVSPKRQLA